MQTTTCYEQHKKHNKTYNTTRNPKHNPTKLNARPIHRHVETRIKNKQTKK